jgi:hypothetical protein
MFAASLQGGKTLKAQIKRELSFKKVRLLHGWLPFQISRQPFGLTRSTATVTESSQIGSRPQGP